MLSMRVSDTGIGIPETIDLYKTSTLGLQLVNMLTAQLGGTIALERGAGTAFIITFPTIRH
jgi:two-component sensor histidine kinase